MLVRQCSVEKYSNQLITYCSYEYVFACDYMIFTIKEPLIYKKSRLDAVLSFEHDNIIKVEEYVIGMLYLFRLSVFLNPQRLYIAFISI